MKVDGGQATEAVRAARTRLAAAARGDRRRLRDAAATDALDWRARRSPVPGEDGSALVAAGALRDAQGAIAAPKRAVDTLDALHRRGALGDAEFAAGRRFEAEFALAGLDSLRALDFGRPCVDGGARRGPDDRAAERLDAADRVWRALEHVGGPASSGGVMLWEIVGRGATLKDVAAARGLNPMAASGALAAALAGLAAHYRRR